MFTRSDYGFEEYSANVLRTANKDIDWHQTIENCLLGLFGELAEVAQELNSSSPLIQQIAEMGKACEYVKKIKYHGKSQKLLDELAHDNYNLAVDSLKPVAFNPKPDNGLMKETGDILYYQFWLIDTLGFDASEVAQTNVEKLRKRYVEGFSIEASLNRKD